MSSPRKWRKSEGGVVGRYGDPRKVLKTSSLVLADGQVDPTKDSFLIDPGLKLSQLKLRLIPSLDQAQVSRLPEGVRQSLGICLVLRDPGVKRFTLIGEWPLEKLPESIALDDIPEFDRIVRNRVVLSMGLTAVVEHDGIELGTTLARKDFHIHTDVSGNQFPHQFVESSYFTEQELPRSTSWYIHVLNEDGDRGADETFIVYINKDLAEIASSRAADAVWVALGTDVFTVLLQRLLRADVAESPLPGSILDQLSRLLLAQGQSLASASDLVQAGDISKIMALAQAITKANLVLRSAL